jgi:pyrroloquinoline quinone biosynthesis protein B
VEKVLVVSLALIDPENNDAWLFEATPDFREQIHELEDYNLKGIFLTHGHIGHYTGLMHLGMEAMGTKNVPVYGMPRMAEFLTNNGPWSQLVSLNNIEIKILKNDSTVTLSENLSITPMLVPHRDEFTETVGFRINGPDKSMIFIPDIDKWEKMDQDIKNVVTKVDYALLDGSFYDGQELPGRDMSEIPHPFIVESINLFGDLHEEDRSKIHFIHFNHTNPLLDLNSPQSNQVISLGYKLTYQGMVLEL